jgi:histidinol phosphatase-like enzyme (inositol monophosphatase family)
LGSNAHKTTFRELKEFAFHLADIAGQAVLPHFRKPIRVENKDKSGAYDPVTKADHAAERAIAKALKVRFPDHTLVGEEFGIKAGTSPYRWVVDPIDGTRAFITGSPLWGTLIGLLEVDRPVLGVMDQPFTGERFWSDEKSSFLRLRDGKPKRIKTRPCARLADAILTSTHPDLFEVGRQQGVLSGLNANVRMTRYGGDCYGYCLLAAGFTDLVVEAGLKSYDIAALIPIIERAGGIVTTWDGGPAFNGGNIIAAGDARVHEAALRLMSKV